MPEEEEDEWDPQPAKLRDPRDRDTMGHAQRNLAQLKQAKEELGEDADDGIDERIEELEEEVENGEDE